MSRSENKRQEIVRTIRDRITSGRYTPGCRLPSQAELAEEFHVAHRTVTLAIAALREDGYVWTVPQKGTYVFPPDHWPQPGAPTPPRQTTPAS